MKRYISSFCYIALIFMLLSGCMNGSKKTSIDTVNNFDGVMMTVKKDTVSSTGATFVIENNSDQQVIYGEYFMIEKERNGDWYEVAVQIDDYGFTDIGYEVAPSEVDEFLVDWEWLYGSLNKGEYRLIKEVLDFREAGDFDEYQLAARFTID